MGRLGNGVGVWGLFSVPRASGYDIIKNRLMRCCALNQTSGHYE